MAATVVAACTVCCCLGGDSEIAATIGAPKTLSTEAKPSPMRAPNGRAIFLVVIARHGAE